MLRVLITRASASPMDVLLRARGAQPIHVPLLALSPTGEPPPEGRPRLVLISSAATARVVPDLAGVLSGATVVAVGRKTAAALRGVGVSVSAMGEGGGAAAVDLVEQLRRSTGAGCIWTIGARALSPQLSAALAAQPWERVHWAVYETRTPDGAGEALAAVLPVDAITFASGSAVRAFVARADPGSARVVVIGPSTAEDAAAVGLTVHAVAARPTLEALCEAATGSTAG